MAAHRYWRLEFLNNWGDSRYRLSGFRLYTTTGPSGTLVTGSGTASADQTQSPNFPVNCVNAGTGSGYWSSNNAVSPQHFSYDFGSGIEYDVQQVGIAPVGLVQGADTFPYEVWVQYSDNGTDYTTSWGFITTDPGGTATLQLYAYDPYVDGRSALTYTDVVVNGLANSQVASNQLDVLMSLDDFRPNAETALTYTDLLVDTPVDDTYAETALVYIEALVPLKEASKGGWVSAIG